MTPERARHRFRWRARSSSARHRLRRNRIRRLGGAGRAAHGRRRSRRGAVDGVPRPRCGCARPGAPTPACTPPVRSPTSTSRSMRCPMPTRAPARRRARVPAAGAPTGAVPARRCPGRRDRPRASGFRRPVLGAAAPLRLPAVDRALRGRAAARRATSPPWPRPLDVDAMAAASRDLLGLHDFAAFCRHRDGATTIRDLQRLDWVRDGDLITAHVSADAFCWSWCGRWSGRCWRSGSTGATRVVRDAAERDAAVQRLRRRAGARPDAGRGGLPARRPTRRAHPGHPGPAHAADASTRACRPRSRRPG